MVGRLGSEYEKQKVLKKLDLYMYRTKMTDFPKWQL